MGDTERNRPSLSGSVKLMTAPTRSPTARLSNTVTDWGSSTGGSFSAPTAMITFVALARRPVLLPSSPESVAVT